MLRGEPRPVTGELHILARGSKRQPLFFVLLEVHFEEALPLAVLAQVVGFDERLARLDGIQGISFGLLMLAQRPPGVPVRRLREKGRVDRRFRNLM
jgi:hypothetical protein